MPTELTLRILLEKPPAGVDFGIQQGSGSAYQTIQKQRSTQKDLVFQFRILLKETADGSTDFSGKYVQGPKGERFIYIDIGTYAGQPGSVWSRRLKVPLKGITALQVNSLAGNDNLVLEAVVPGMGSDGGPNCGTVKPFNGWKVVDTGSE